MVNIIGLGMVLMGVWIGNNLAEMTGFPSIVTLFLGVALGATGFAASQKAMRKRERDWKFALETFLRRYEKDDEPEKKGSDSFSLFYLGGYTNLKATADPDFGTLTIQGAHLTFKGARPERRFTLKISRIKRLSLETETTLRAKRVKVTLKVTTSKNKLIASVLWQIRKRIRYVMLEYQDDLGEKLLIVFRPANPVDANNIKTELTKAISRSRKSGKQENEENEPAEKVEAPVVPAARPVQPLPPRPMPARMQSRPGGLAFEYPPVELVIPRVQADPAPRTAGVFRPNSLERKYDVVLLGPGETDSDKESLAQLLSNHFSLPMDSLLPLVKRIPVAAKKGLSYSDAELLASAFLVAGAQVTIDVSK